jgi:hypothetical protein
MRRKTPTTPQPPRIGCWHTSGFIRPGSARVKIITTDGERLLGGRNGQFSDADEYCVFLSFDEAITEAKRVLAAHPTFIHGFEVHTRRTHGDWTMAAAGEHAA